MTLVLSLLSNCYLMPRANILCLSLSISHVYSVNILSYFTELKMRNIVFLGALALVSASDDQSCYAHISVSYIRG